MEEAQALISQFIHSILESNWKECSKVEKALIFRVIEDILLPHESRVGSKVFYNGKGNS